MASSQDSDRTSHRDFDPTNPSPHLPPDRQNTAPEPISAEKLHAFEEVLRQEISQLHRRPGQSLYSPSSMHDHAFLSTIHHIRDSTESLPLSEIKDLLLGLRWRFRLQETYLLTFHKLLLAGLINPYALDKPMAIGRDHDALESIVELLEGFDDGAVCGLYSNTYANLTRRLGYGRFESPIRWLGIVILRSEPEMNLKRIVARFVDTGCFGNLQEENLKYLRPFYPQGAPDANLPLKEGDEGAYEFGFWMPHGVSGVSFMRWAERIEERYASVRDVFEMFFGEGTWGSANGFLQLLQSYKGKKFEYCVKSASASICHCPTEALGSTQMSKTATRILETFLCSSQEAETRAAVELVAERSESPPFMSPGLFDET